MNRGRARPADHDGRAGEQGARLYGVLAASPGEAHAPADGSYTAAAARRIVTQVGPVAVDLVRVRDVVAVVGAAPFVAVPPTPPELDMMHAVVMALFAERVVLPAPPGTLFRSRRAVAAWLELHAAALSEALRYVDDRVEGRVHAAAAEFGATLTDAATLAVAAPAASTPAALPEVLHALRRHAVALLVLRDGIAEASRGAVRHPSDGAGDTAPEVDRGTPSAAVQAAFLIERAQWSTFAQAVARERATRPDLGLELTGPWPPYSFVRLDFVARHLPAAADVLP